VVVPVVIVGGMPLVVVDVVGMVPVGDGDVPALRAMLMVMILMRRVLAGGAFVGVIPVRPVDVAVVRVVGVIAVPERDVAAALGMDVRMIVVRGVLVGVRHFRHSESPSSGTPGTLRLRPVRINERDPDIGALHPAQLRWGFGHDGRQRREHPSLDKVAPARRRIGQPQHDVQVQV
jgi:hypothetical protein